MNLAYTQNEHKEQMKEIIMPCLKLLMDGVNNKKNVFPEFVYPLEALQALDSTIANY